MLLAMLEEFLGYLVHLGAHKNYPGVDTPPLGTLNWLSGAV